ncbi:MAG: transglycosylase domain-containing protein [Oscillospiraceae bacterium]|nr:transglycosylase domain-containing protein [Oscillospiraceae bacterium]
MSTSKKRRPSRVARVIRFGIGQLMRLLVTVFLICVITGCIVATSMIIYVMNFMETDNNVNLDNVNLSFTTMFYVNDENGQPQEVYRMSGDQNRIEISLDQVSQNLLNAYVATEDKRFYQHEGVDWIRTIGVSIRAVLKGEKQGGSTITQQVIKNVTKDDDVTPVRKLREIFRALELERNYTKEEILESYLNLIFLGKNIYGVEAASQYYFGCSASELTIPQAATLAGMTRSPNYYRPDLHPDRAKERRNYALECMKESGFITEAQYKAYCAEPMVTVDRTVSTEENTSSQSGGVTSYFTDMVIEDVISDLMEANNWSRDYASYMLRNGGYRIYMTEDMQLQQLLEEKYNDPRTFSQYDLTENENGDIPESAFVIMDYEGHVLAVVGGKGEKTETLGFNRATMAKRPPGSSIKPLAVYGPALEYDIINWSTVLNDSAAMKINDKDWPSNYEKDYRGDMTVVEALRISRNTIPVKIMLQLTTEKSIDFLQKKLGITTLVTSGSQNDYGPSLAIGSMTDGVYLRELTAAYAPFGNGGVYYSPESYTRIEDASGNVILDNTPKKTRAFSEDTASIMNRLLQVVCQSGTGRESNIGAMPVVGKTGTTQDYKDMSFVGLSPYYVGGVWTGYDTPAELPYKNMYDTDTIWSNVMRDVHEGLEVRDFTLSENIVQMEYCKISGLAATSACSETAMGYYKTNAKPDLCDAIHDKDSGEDEGGDGSGAASSGTAPSGPSFTTNPNATGGGSPGDAADVD